MDATPDGRERDWGMAAIVWLVLGVLIAICWHGCGKPSGTYGWDPSLGPYKVETEYERCGPREYVIPVSEAEYTEAINH
jgi:hypothetical protein